MKRLLLVFTFILFITGCSNEISEQELAKIEISMYTPRPATIRSYDFLKEDGSLLNKIEYLTTYSESQQELVVRENNRNIIYVESYRVNKDEFVLTSTTTNSGHNSLEKIILTNKQKQWDDDETQEERSFYEISGLNMIVETTYGKFEDCIEVTHMVDGEVYLKIYYAPYVGEVAMNNSEGMRVVDLTDILVLRNYDEMNAIYDMHLSGNYQDYSLDDNEYDDYDEGLNSAAIKGDLEAIKSLINGGEYIDRKNEFGITMLMEASRNGHIDIIEYLLENGANPNEMAGNGETALFWAVDCEDIDIIKMLLDAGAETNLKGDFDRTPLLIACELGNVGIARILLENGANPNLKLDTPDESTPLSVAKEKGIEELIILLQDY